MAINEIPIGTYTDAAGVVDSTAAAEIVALGVIVKGFIPDPEATDAATEGVSGAAPDYDNVPPAFAVHIRAELDAFLAAIAAAPTS